MALILLFALLLQTTVCFSFFATLGKFSVLSFLSGHTFDFVFLLLIYLSLHRSFWTAWIWASLISLCCEALGFSWRGGQTLSYIIIATVLSFARQYLMLRTPIARFAFFVAISMADACLQYYWGSFFVRAQFFWGNYGLDMLIQGLINSTVATLFVSALSEFDYWAQGYRFSEQNVVFSDGRRNGIKII